MKKIVLLVAIYQCCTFGLSAQDERQFRFGIQASPTFSWMTSDSKSLETSGTNWGLKLAIMAEKYFQPNYAIVSGIGFGFNHGGFLQSTYDRYRPWVGSDLSINLNETDAESLPTNSELHYRLRYVEVPLGLKMRGGTNEDAQFKFFAEPLITLGFVSKALGDITGAGSAFNTTDENIRKDVNGLALSWGFGGGVEYEVSSNTSLVGGIFFQNNFTDVTQKARVKETRTSSWEDEKAKSSWRALTLRIGILF